MIARILNSKTAQAFNMTNSNNKITDGKENAYQTQQEAFWAGEFGSEYISRNQGEASVASNLALFSRALQRTSGIKSYCEFGANIGLNLRALRQLLPQAALSAIEINADAVTVLRDWVKNVVGGRYITAPFWISRRTSLLTWR